MPVCVSENNALSQIVESAGGCSGAHARVDDDGGGGNGLHARARHPPARATAEQARQLRGRRRDVK